MVGVKLNDVLMLSRDFNLNNQDSQVSLNHDQSWEKPRGAGFNTIICVIITLNQLK